MIGIDWIDTVIGIIPIGVIFHVVAVVVHVIAALVCLFLGAVVLTAKKGTRRHKILGRAWAGIMFFIAFTSFWIGDDFSYIHVISVWVIFGLIMAILAIRFIGGRRGVKIHRGFMIGNYIGLWAAAIPAFITEGRLMHQLTAYYLF
jgi:uncharacterized membrane protein